MPEVMIAVLGALLGAFAAWHWTSKWHKMAQAAARHESSADAREPRTVVAVNVMGTDGHTRKASLTVLSDLPPSTGDNRTGRCAR